MLFMVPAGAEAVIYPQVSAAAAAGCMMLECFHTLGKVLLISGKRDHHLQRSLLDLLTVQLQHNLLLTERLRVQGGEFDHFCICVWICFLGAKKGRKCR